MLSKAAFSINTLYVLLAGKNQSGLAPPEIYGNECESYEHLPLSPCVKHFAHTSLIAACNMLSSAYCHIGGFSPSP